METKQLLQQQSLNGSSRLRRSHSQNTRSQSVRRTSIREKRDTSRREAREEAKIRHHLDDEPSSKLTDAKQSAQQPNSASSNQQSTKPALLTTNLTNVTSINNVNQSSFNHHQLNQNSLNIPFNTSSPLGNYAQDHQSSKDVIRNQQDNQTLNKQMNLYKDQQQFSKSTDAGCQADASLKLEINVNQQANGHNNYPTNCSNVNTLSDLKRFRTDLRHRNNQPNSDLKESMINNELYKNASNLTKYNEQQMVDGLVNRFDNNQSKFNKSTGVTQNQNNHNNNYLTPSPNSTLKKFRGDPSDMIGEMQKRKCCSMM